MQIIGNPLKIRITDEYLDIVPTLGDSEVSAIDTTETSPLNFVFTPRSASGDTLTQSSSYKIDIYDDATNELIE